VVEAVVDHQFGFAELGASDANGARRDLHMGDLWAFMRLAMWPPGALVPRAIALHRPYISFENIEV
jgi:hypothetical protein